MQKPIHTICISILVLGSVIISGMSITNVFSQSLPVITADFQAVRRTTREPIMGLNMFAYDHATLTNPQYQESLLYMNPGIIRVHNSEMMSRSTNSAYGWLTETGWDSNRINTFAQDIRALQDRGLTSKVFINVPGFPVFANGETDPSAYGSWMGELANILFNTTMSFEGIEITNELEDNLDTATILVPAYIAAAQAIKQVNPTIKTGGLSFEQVQAEDYEAFIDGVSLINPQLLDFVSYHQYGGGDQSTNPTNLLNNGAKWNTFDISNNIRTYLNSKGLTNTRVFHNEFNVCWSFHCEDSNVLSILQITDPEQRSDAFAACIESTQCGDVRMRNQFSTVYDATILSYHLDSQGDGITAWNDKDFFYGKIDHLNKLRSSGFNYTLLSRREPQVVFEVTNTEEGIDNGIKASSWLDITNQPHILLINRQNVVRDIQVDTTMNAQNQVRQITEQGYTMQTGYFETGSAPQTLSIHAYSVVLISPQGSISGANGLTAISAYPV